MGILFSVSDAIKTAMHDSSYVDERDQRKFAQRNRLQVYTAANTWLLLMADIGVPVGLTLAVRRLLTDFGLTRVVAACRDIADMFLEGLAVDQLPEEHCFEAEVASMSAIHRLFGAICDIVASDPARETDEKCAALLQLLLFLERFTYIGGTPSVDASIAKFLAANLQCRTMEYDWAARPGRYITEMCRMEFSEMLDERFWPGLAEDWKGFSSGSYVEAMVEPRLTEGMKSPLMKWVYLSRYTPTYMGELIYPFVGGRNYPRTHECPLMTLVPKNFETLRVIFPEDIPMSYHAHGVLEAFRQMLNNNGLARYINEHDQSINRSFARIGSYDGNWATIDMSSASDTISKGLFSEFCPIWFKRVMSTVCSRYFIYRVDGKTVKKKLFTLLTSGNPMTWLFESVWFLALARVAVRLAGGDPYTSAFVYGDDLIVRAEYYSTLCELLACVGHNVNLRKSYGSGWFRESCGGWYYHGVDVTPVYWPRRSISNDKVQCIPPLVDLQHKALTLGAMSMNEFLVASITALYPKMTYSSPGSAYTDIWDPNYDPYTDDIVPHVYFHSVKEHHPETVQFQDYTLDVRDFASHLAYYQYLQHGPMYDSYLDQVLGVSTSRLDRLLEYDTGLIQLRLS